MSNKPQNVVRHEHFFAPDNYAPRDELKDNPRIDACLLADGSCVVWDADNDRIVAHAPDFKSACRIARSEVERLYPESLETEEAFVGRSTDKLVLAILVGLLVACVVRYLFGAP